MELRPASQKEIDNNEEIIYQTRDQHSHVEVTVIGFVQVNGLDCYNATLWVIQKWNGTIILATDEQLFVEAD